MNALRTTILLSGLTVLLVLVGGAVGGRGGMVFALVIAAAMNFGSYWFSDRLVLKMHGAREASAADAPELYNVVRELAHSAQLPMPRVYVMESDTPNAFATGRNPCACGGSRDHRPAAHHEPRGAARCACPRVGSCASSRHAHWRHCGDLCRRDHHDREHGAVGHALRRFPGQRRSRRCGGHARRLGDDHSRAAGGRPDPDGGVALTRVRGRPGWGRDLGQPHGSGQCTAQARAGQSATSDAIGRA